MMSIMAMEDALRKRVEVILFVDVLPLLTLVEEVDVDVDVDVESDVDSDGDLG